MKSITGSVVVVLSRFQQMPDPGVCKILIVGLSGAAPAPDGDSAGAGTKRGIKIVYPVIPLVKGDPAPEVLRFSSGQLVGRGAPQLARG